MLLKFERIAQSWEIECLYIRKSWLGALDHFIIKWTVKWIQYLFCGILYLKRRKSWWCTDDVRLNWLWTFNIGICKHQGRSLVHGYCRRIKYIYNFLTISCVLNWGIDSSGVNNSRIIFNTNRIIRFLLRHRCFLRGYLMWWIVRWTVKSNENQEL